MTNPLETRRARYLTRLLDRFGAVSLPVGPLDVPLALDAIFQPLQLRRDPLAAEDLPRARRRRLLGEHPPDDDQDHNEQDQPETTPLVARNAPEALALSAGPRIVILGGPGTGKTTALRDLVVRAARAAQADPAAPLPLFLSLPEFARAGGDLRAALDRLAADLDAPDGDGALLWDAVAAGQALLCLDSLDEVAPDLRPSVIAFISRAAPRLGGNWIVGSRFTEYKGGQFGADQFAEWELLPLDADLRRALAARLLPALARLLGGAAPAAETFIQAVETHPQAAAWGENPLLLSLLAVAYVRQGALPGSRAALYAAVLDAVLAARAQDEGERAQLRAVLERVALDLYRVKGRTFTRADLRVALPPNAGPDWAERLVQSGALDAVARDTFGFRHQTFQEFLAGAALARDLAGPDDARRAAAWDLAWSKRTYSRWTEVLRLMAGVLAREYDAGGVAQAERWLRALLAQATSPEGDPGDLGLVLALRTAGELADAGPAWQTRRPEAEAAVGRAWAVMASHSGMSHDRQRHDEADLRRFGADAIAVIAEVLLVAALGPDEAYRYQAWAALGLLGPLAPTAPLLALALDPPVGKRSHALDAARSQALDTLRNRGQTAVWPRVLPLLADPDERVRRSAAELLARTAWEGDMGALAALVARAGPEIPSGIRRVAVEALGEAGPHAPLEPLIAALTDQRTAIRIAAARALKDQVLRVPVALLLGATSDPEPGVRREIAEALKLLGEQAPQEALLALLSDRDFSVRRCAADALGALKQDMPVGALLGLLATGDPQTQRGALMALRSCPDPLPLAPLVALMEHPDDQLAREAAQRFGQHATVLEIVARLNHRRAQVRSSLVVALGERGRRAPAEALLPLLDDPIDAVRACACMALEKIGNPLAVTPLLHRLADEEAMVRLAAASALAHLGEPGGQIAPAAFLQALLTATTDDCEIALRVLAACDASEARAALLAACDDQRSGVRAGAIAGLQKSGADLPTAIFLRATSDTDDAVRRAAVDALGARLDAPGVRECFVAALGDSDTEVRRIAIRQLALHPARLPVADILALAQSDPDMYTRICAIEALGAAAPAEFLLAALDDPQTNDVALKALAQVPGRRVAERLVELIPQIENDYQRELLETAFRQHRGFLTPEMVRPFAVPEVAAATRVTAYGALAALGERVPDAMLLPLLDDEDESAQLGSLRILCAQTPEIPLATLFGVLRRHNWPMNRVLQPVLAAWDPAELLPALQPLLDDADLECRKAAIEVVALVDGPQATALLLTALADPATVVVSMAAIKLWLTGRDVPLAPLYAALEVPGAPLAHLAAAIAVLGGDPPLQPLLDDLEAMASDYDTGQGVIGLKALGGRAPRAALLPMLGNNGCNIHPTVVEVLQATHPDALREVMPEALAILRAGQVGDILGAAARMQLAWIVADMAPVPPALHAYLAELLDWPYWPVREAAISALARIRRHIPDATIRKLLALRRRAGDEGKMADGALAAILSLEAGIEDD